MLPNPPEFLVKKNPAASVCLEIPSVYSTYLFSLHTSHQPRTGGPPPLLRPPRTEWLPPLHLRRLRLPSPAEVRAHPAWLLALACLRRCARQQLESSKIGWLARSCGGLGAGPAAGHGGGGGRPAGAHGDPRQGRLHLRLPQRRHCLAIQGMH